MKKNSQGVLLEERKFRSLQRFCLNKISFHLNLTWGKCQKTETFNSENTNRPSSLSIPEWGWDAGPFSKWFFPSKFSLEYTFCWNSVASNTCSYNDATVKSCVPQEASPSRSGQFSLYHLLLRVNLMCWHFTCQMEQWLPEPSCRQFSAALYFLLLF